MRGPGSIRTFRVFFPRLESAGLPRFLFGVVKGPAEARNGEYGKTEGMNTLAHFGPAA